MPTDGRALASSPPHHAAFRLAEIAETATPPVSYDPQALRCLRTTLDFDVGFFVRDDAIGATGEGLVREVVETYGKRFPLYGRELRPVFQVARNRGMAVDREVLGRSLERTRLFREFMGPHGGHSTLLVPIAFRDDNLAVLALGRNARGFSPAELCAFRTLLPVLRLCEATRDREVPDWGLTRRERDVLDYLCLGYGNQEIARACDTSVNTVRNQLQAVYRKVGASNRAEAVGIALGRRP